MKRILGGQKGRNPQGVCVSRIKRKAPPPLQTQAHHRRGWSEEGLTGPRAPVLLSPTQVHKQVHKHVDFSAMLVALLWAPLIARDAFIEVAGPPPPACPPHCVPPIYPAGHNLAPNCTFVRAGSTGAGIDEYNRSGHYVCAPPASHKLASPRLLVYFTGTAPSDCTLFVQAAASRGFHALGLSYNNFGAPNGQCDVSYPSNQTISDPDCEFDVEEARLFGGNRSAALWAHRLTNPYALVNTSNSIMHRLESLLEYSTTHRAAGSAAWSAFLVNHHRREAAPSTGSDPGSGSGPGTGTGSGTGSGSGGGGGSGSKATAALLPNGEPPSGSNIAWAKIVLSGWSRGSAYPVHISKYFPVSRLILFCGLEDYVGLRGPDSKPEPWIYEMKGKTPPEQIFGFGGLHGGCCSNWMTNWAETGLRLPGQGFADDKSGSRLLAANATGLATALNGSRRVYLRGPKVGHGTPIYDWTMPRTADPSGASLPLYLPVWEYMLTTTAPAGGTQIPIASGLPCCFIDERMKLGKYAPRGCNRTI